MEAVTKGGRMVSVKKASGAGENSSENSSAPVGGDNAIDCKQSNKPPKGRWKVAVIYLRHAWRMISRAFSTMLYGKRPHRSKEPAEMPRLKPTPADSCWPTLHRLKVRRFEFTWNGNALTIIDKNHRIGRAYPRYENITAHSELDILEWLMSRYATGSYDFSLPLNKVNWQANTKGDAALFIQQQTETWLDAYPTSGKEARRLHKAHRRILPDHKPLRNQP